MKVFIDARWVRTDYYDGISRYTASLTEAFAKLQPVTMIIHDERQLRLLPKNVPYVKLNNPFSLKEFFIARKLNKLGASAVFSPLQTMGPLGKKYKLILTVQDLIYYKNPKPPTHLPWLVRGIWWLYHQAYWPQKLLLKSADAVATVSETSKKEILQHKFTNKPVFVVSNAPTGEIKKANLKKTKKDIVYMGSFMPYKNVETLIKGMEYLPDYTLHLLSKVSSRRKNELEELIPKNTKVVFHNGVSEKEYNELLSSASALATASTAEGFGLPIIEAMAKGVPAVCADTEIFHEVGGNAALYFSATSSEVFAKQIKKLENKQNREEIINKGLAQSKKFSWQKSGKNLKRNIDIVSYQED